jgi:DNA-binding NarL/FixJ family response regulator
MGDKVEGRNSTKRMETTKIVLADDHVMVRKYIRQILQREPDLEVVGEASNGVEAIYTVNLYAPDILLLDMEMPVLDGVSVARELHAAKSPVRILALSAYDDRHYIRELLANGAAGYITKDEAPDCILDAIRSVARGETSWISERAQAVIKDT